MNRSLAIALIIGALFLGAGGGILGFITITGGNDEPSEDVDDVRDRLSLDDPTPVNVEAVLAENADLQAQLSDFEATMEAFDAADLQGEIDTLQSTIVAQADSIASLEAAASEAPTEEATEVATEASSDPVSTEEPAEAVTMAPTEDVTEVATEASSDPLSTEEPSTSASDGTPMMEIPEGVTRALYVMVPDESEARYSIDELLRGDPVTVVGVTQDDELGDIGADIIINFEDISQSQIGEVVINARRFETPERGRDNAVRCCILDTESYEFIRFQPTAITGLESEAAQLGETYTFEVEGELTIRDVTRVETFEVEVRADSFDRISGYGRTVIEYRNYGISIDAPGFVRDIEETVILEIEFIAALEETR